jgi:hypothetical protein
LQYEAKKEQQKKTQGRTIIDQSPRWYSNFDGCDRLPLLRYEWSDGFGVLIFERSPKIG